MTDFTNAEAGSIPKCASPSTAEAFEGLMPDEFKSLARNIFGVRRGPIRYTRGQTIVFEGDASEYIYLVISGVVGSLKSFQDGTRSILAFYLTTEFFGLTDRPTHLFSVEAVADANILFFKRSALASMAKDDTRIANFLMTTTLAELLRSQEHSLRISRDAKSRVASFLIDLSKRMGTRTWLDLPMTKGDIADHLGITIETVSRVITQMENEGLIARDSHRNLILKDRRALARLAK
jgi:CRP/FNR family transcriptional regulator, nitrogen fixation regulation protein